MGGITPPASDAAARRLGDLTPRQREVLDLVSEGLTNPQIAERLGISLDGAKHHVSEVLTRLGFATREEAGSWWRTQRGLGAMPRRARRRALALGALLGAGAAAAVAAVLVLGALGGKGREERLPAGAWALLVGSDPAQAGPGQLRAALTDELRVVNVETGEVLLARRSPGASYRGPAFTPSGSHAGFMRVTLLDDAGQQVKAEVVSVALPVGSEQSAGIGTAQLRLGAEVSLAPTGDRAIVFTLNQLSVVDLVSGGSPRQVAWQSTLEEAGLSLPGGSLGAAAWSPGSRYVALPYGDVVVLVDLRGGEWADRIPQASLPPELRAQGFGIDWTSETRFVAYSPRVTVEGEVRGGRIRWKAPRPGDGGRDARDLAAREVATALLPGAVRASRPTADGGGDIVWLADAAGAERAVLVRDGRAVVVPAQPGPFTWRTVDIVVVK